MKFIISKSNHSPFTSAEFFISAASPTLRRPTLNLIKQKEGRKLFRRFGCSCGGCGAWLYKWGVEVGEGAEGEKLRGE